MDRSYGTSDGFGDLPVDTYRKKKRPLGRNRTPLGRKNVKRPPRRKPRHDTSPMQAYGAILLVLAAAVVAAWLFVTPLATRHRERTAGGLPVPNRTVYASQMVNVRDQPDTHSLIRRTLRPGEAVRASASDRTHWTQVFGIDGKSIGWVHGAYLRDAPPVVQAGVAAAPAAQPRSLVSPPLAAGTDARPVTAICRDGWQSHAEHHQGSCAGHDGVRQFLR
jgi:SH3-like domain-containing protein